MWTHTGRDGEISTLKSLVTNSPFVSSPAISNSRETRRRIKQSHLKLVTNRSKCPNLLHFSLSHTHTHISQACWSAVSSCVKSTSKLWAAPHHYYHKERSPAPQVHTQSLSGPAPLPPLSHTPLTHTHTHNGHSRAKGPTMQSCHTRTQTSPYHIREGNEW